MRIDFELSRVLHQLDYLFRSEILYGRRVRNEFYASYFFVCQKTYICIVYSKSDSLIKEWDLDTFTCLRALKAHEGPVKDIIVLDSRIISCGEDKAILWDLTSKSQMTPKKRGSILLANTKKLLKNIN